MTFIWGDPGGSATGGTQFATSITGGVTAQTSVNNGQAYAYQMTTSSPSATAVLRRNAVLQAAGNRLSVYIRVPALPSDNVGMRVLGAAPTGSNVGTLLVTLGSDGKLRLYSNGTSTALGAAGATVLSTGQWYRISLSYAITSTTNWSAKVYVNGTLEMTRTNTDGTLSSAVPTDLHFLMNNTLAVNTLLYVSDIYVDDTTDQTDPGDVHVTAKQPTTTTTNNFDTTLGTGAVNERPVSTTNGKQHAATSDVDQDYEIQSVSAGDANITGATIIGNTAWIWATLGSLTGTPSTNIIRNGARETATWDPATANTAQLFTVVSTSATYPQDANGKNIGSSSSVIAADTFLYDCGVVIAYIPSTGDITMTAVTATATTASQVSALTGGLVMLAAVATITAASGTASLLGGLVMGAPTATATTQSETAALSGAAGSTISAAVATATTTAPASTLAGASTLVANTATATADSTAAAFSSISGITANTATATAASSSSALAGGLVMSAATGTATAASGTSTISGLSLIPAGTATATAGSDSATITGAASTARYAIVTWIEFEVPPGGSGSFIAGTPTASADGQAATYLTGGRITAPAATATAVALGGSFIGTIIASPVVVTADAQVAVVSGGARLTAVLSTSTSASAVSALRGGLQIVAPVATATAQAFVMTPTTQGRLTALTATAAAASDAAFLGEVGSPGPTGVGDLIRVSVTGSLEWAGASGSLVPSLINGTLTRSGV